MKKLKFLLPLLLLFTLLMTSCNLTPGGDGEGGGEEPEIETVSIADAKATCQNEGIGVDELYIRASVKSVNGDSMVIVDSTGELTVNGVHGEDKDGGRIEYSALDVKPMVDYEVLVRVSLQNLGGKISAWDCVLVETKFSTDGYTVMTVAEAREASVGEKITVDGTVSAITYSNGLVPAGVILVDETSSIYIYSATLAAEVKVGNKITVGGTKDYWVLEDEQTNAEKHGYKGCCQLKDVTLFANDLKNNDFDKSWIEEISVKELLDTPVNQDITSKVYKVNALIKEAPNQGFTNFYFYDIDGKTGTYAYTQCNGSDLAWLREFDGKFCTVYITALNAKATASDCYFRFLPVAVYDEGYVFNASDAPEYAVKYHGMPQLKETYTGDPKLSLNTSVSSELLGFEGAVLSFTSSDESVVKFDTVDGVTVMSCPGFGTATVTVKATYGEYEYSESIEITVEDKSVGTTDTVANAIAAAVGETVTVTGIVGPSIIHSNHVGFYLMGESEMIAVSFLSADTLKDIAIGNTVTITGTRDLIKDSMISITNATLINNEYGSAALPLGAIIDGVALESISATNDTTHIYRVTATPKFVVDQYSKTYEISGVQLYSNSTSQYVILDDYLDTEVTLLVSVANWNGKAFKLCVVGIETEDGAIYNEFCFDKVKK